MPYQKHDAETKDFVELHERVKSVEVIIERLDKNVEKIMDNHLPHIQIAVDSVQKNFRMEIDKIIKRLEKAEINWAKIIGAGAVLLFIIDLIVNYISKFIK